MKERLVDDPTPKLILPADSAIPLIVSTKSTVIGRGHQCTVQITTSDQQTTCVNKISRVHAIIHAQDNDKYTIESIGINGIRLNGHWVQGCTCELNIEDLIAFPSSVMFKFMGKKCDRNEKEPAAKDDVDMDQMASVIIESFTFCGTSDLTLPDLIKEIKINQVKFRTHPDPPVWHTLVLNTLQTMPIFALRPRNKCLKLRTHWFYNYELDTNQERVQAFLEFRSALPIRKAKRPPGTQYYIADSSHAMPFDPAIDALPSSDCTVLDDDKFTYRSGAISTRKPLVTLVSDD